jgi:hypothetical protein
MARCRGLAAAVGLQREKYTTSPIALFPAQANASTFEWGFLESLQAKNDTAITES